MLFWILVLIVTHVGAFVAGALVYRNNTKKAEALVVKGQDEYAALKKQYDELKNLKDKVGG